MSKRRSKKPIRTEQQHDFANAAPCRHCGVRMGLLTWRERLLLERMEEMAIVLKRVPTDIIDGLVAENERAYEDNTELPSWPMSMIDMTGFNVTQRIRRNSELAQAFRTSPLAVSDWVRDNT